MFLFLFISLTLWMWILSLKVCIIVTFCICFVFCIYHDCSTTSILHPLLHFVNWTIWTNIFGIYFSVYVFFVCSGSIRWIRANVMSGQKYQFISCFCCVNCFPFFFFHFSGLCIFVCWNSHAIVSICHQLPENSLKQWKPQKPAQKHPN